MTLKRLLFWIGIVFWILGFIGGFEILEDKTGWPSFNKLTKDQVMLLFGVTWVALGMKD